MNEKNKAVLNLFNRNSYISLLFYLLAVGVSVFFVVNEYEKIIETSIKLITYALYLGFMVWSLVNLKNYFENTRKDDYSMDVLIYAMIGIPLYVFAFFYIRGKLKNDLSNL